MAAAPLLSGLSDVLATRKFFMRLIGQLDLMRCSHCGVDSPTLPLVHNMQTKAVDGSNPRHWGVYVCRRCGGAILAYGGAMNDRVLGIFPAMSSVEETVPGTAREYLVQAMNSRHAPAGAVMLAASSVDAMLKAKGLDAGSLYSRIDKAAADHLITSDMAAWAHDVRLEANGQRHADGNFSLPTSVDADRVIDFAKALAELLFVLPARVSRGRASAGS